MGNAILHGPFARKGAGGVWGGGEIMRNPLLPPRKSKSGGGGGGGRDMLPDITPDKKISSYRRENETKKVNTK